MTPKKPGIPKSKGSSKAHPVGQGFGEVDLNCDMGEGMPGEEIIMRFISSANIACGYHAGDEDTMKRTVEIASHHGVAIGAHPSFPDRENFGRKEMNLDEDILYDIIVLQIRVLDAIAEMAGLSLHHVKPHGALYNMAAKDPMVAAVIARAVKDIDPSLLLYGLSGSYLISEAKTIGLKTASEVFADRTYQDDGSLTPRTQPGALIETEEASIQQVLQMVKNGTVSSVSGKIIPIRAETICIHGDGRNAVAFAKLLHGKLHAEGFRLKAPG